MLAADLQRALASPRAGAGRHRLGGALLRDRRFAHPRLEDPHPGHGGRQRLVRRVRAGRATPIRVRSTSPPRRCVWKNGEPCGSGTGAAVQGHRPRRWPGWPTRWRPWGIPFPAGELILSGLARHLVPAAPATTTMQIEGLGGAPAEP